MHSVLRKDAVVAAREFNSSSAILRGCPHGRHCLKGACFKKWECGDLGGRPPSGAWPLPARYLGGLAAALDNADASSPDLSRRQQHACVSSSLGITPECTMQLV